MIDEKIPAEERDRLAIVACGNDVLWIVGRRVSEEFKADQDTANVLEITIREKTT